MISVTSSLTAIVFLSGLNKQTSPDPHDNGADHFRLESALHLHIWFLYSFLKKEGHYSSWLKLKSINVMRIWNFINLQWVEISFLQTEYMFFVVEPLLLEVSSCDWYPMRVLLGILKRSLYCCLKGKNNRYHNEKMSQREIG